MQEIIDAWYTDTCSACETPGGYRVIRIGSNGRVEQLNDAGEWEPATDDYYIPPPEAREGGTDDDQRCLAAENATNALHMLYENLADSWNGDLDNAEAITAMIGGLVGIVGFAAAPIVYGITAFFLPIFAALYTGLEYLFADLWDESVDKQIKCFLYECSTNDGGVVTFDWDCFTGKLNSLANGFSLTAEQVRLYIQVSYLLYCIGGVDMLNLAGATTAITSPDCDDCDNLWCRAEDFSVSAYNWEAATEFSFPAIYADGCFNSDEVFIGANDWDIVGIKQEFVVPATFTEANFSYEIDLGTVSGSCPTAIHFYLGGVFQDGIAIDPSDPMLDGIQWTGTVVADKVLFFIFASNNAGTGSAKICAMTCKGTGENPFGDTNCV